MDDETISREFQDKERTFKNLETEAKYVLSKSLEATDIKLHSITSRLKELPSFLDKCKRIEAKTPFDEINDIVGLRVICLFLSDIERVGQIIRKSFLVLSEDNKIEGSEVSAFGYMSVHFIATMKKEYAGPRYDPIASLRFEIQVRTIAMDAWANVSHYLEYKSETDIPADLRRDFYALSGLFYVADKHFEMFFGERRKSQKRRSKLFDVATAEAKAEELNLDSLTAYLEKTFPDRKRAPSKLISEFVTELLRAGYRRINDIDRVVERTRNAVEEYETHFKPEGMAGHPKLNDVGFVRVAARLVDPDYYRKVLGRDDADVEKTVTEEQRILLPYRKLIQ
ncbi:MAG TPA: hypothetical protein VN696_00730 [Pyrinomonadaceae bacterium]|nr:hypothetical protein [Pyrinomonadaceae bacterium]